MSFAIIPGIHPEIKKPPLITELKMDADEREAISVTEFVAQSNGSIRRKGRDFLLSSGVNNHREHRGHREKRHCSVLSVYSVVDQLHSDSFSHNKFKNNKPQMNADKRRLVAAVHRKGREERKAEDQISLCSGMTIINNRIYRIDRMVE